MLDKFALKFNKCTLNLEDMKTRKNNQRIKNDFNIKSVSESRFFFIHHQHFEYKTRK